MKPFNLKSWIETNRHLLKPPVGNQQVYKGNDDFIVMVVGGPNARKDFHYNESEELFYQLEGSITIRVVEEGKFVDISLHEGDMFLLPSKTPHCPQRPANTIGLVIERNRSRDEKDGFIWYCEKCDYKLYEEYIDLTDIVTELPIVMNKFYTSLELRTCKSCGAVMEPPQK